MANKKAYIVRTTDSDNNTTFPITRAEAVFTTGTQTLDTKLADIDADIEELKSRPISSDTRVISIIIECDGANWWSAEHITEAPTDIQDVLKEWNDHQNKSVAKPRETDPIHWIMKVEDSRIFCSQPVSYKAVPIEPENHLVCDESQQARAEDDWHFEEVRKCGIHGVVVLSTGSVYLASLSNAEMDLKLKSYESGPWGDYWCKDCQPDICFTDSYMDTCPVVPKTVDRSDLNKVWYPCHVYRRPYSGKFALQLTMITSKTNEDLAAEGVDIEKLFPPTEKVMAVPEG